MKNRTITVTLPASREKVFSFLSRIENLPEWAAEFFPEIKREGRYWKARTPFGPSFVALIADAATGVIDLFQGDSLDEMNLLPIRVLSLPHGSAVTATYFDSPDLTSELHDQQYQSLMAQMRGLIRRFGGGELHAQVADDRLGLALGIVTGHFYETWDFYTQQLGFRTVYEQDGLVHLVHASGAQVRVLVEELQDRYAHLVSATDGRGLWLNLRVVDAEAEYLRLAEAGVTIVAPPEDKTWGEREFIVQDPNGILICIAHACNAPLALAAC